MRADWGRVGRSRAQESHTRSLKVWTNQYNISRWDSGSHKSVILKLTEEKKDLAAGSRKDIHAQRRAALEKLAPTATFKKDGEHVSWVRAAAKR